MKQTHYFYIKQTYAICNIIHPNQIFCVYQTKLNLCFNYDRNSRSSPPSIDVLRNRCSENMQQIYRRTPMPRCNFNKVALQKEKNKNFKIEHNRLIGIGDKKYFSTLSKTSSHLGHKGNSHITNCVCDRKCIESLK